MAMTRAWRGIEDFERERQENVAMWFTDRRRNKRDYRKAWQTRWPELKQRKSRGWRRHVRATKAA